MRLLDHDAANLLQAVVQKPTEARSSVIAELVGRVHDWDALIAAARHHGILPALFKSLPVLEETSPSEGVDLARFEYERNAFQCFANAAELLEILDAFNEAGIPAMPFKGVVLGVSAYGDMTARTAGDLDILIFYRDLLSATRIMQKRGYRLTTKVLEDGSPEAENYFEYHFERPDDGMVVELRWRLELTQPRYRRKLGMDWVWPRRRTVKLVGAQVPNLDPISGLLVLCMHGSKHVWSRLVWVCDVARFLESEPGLDWEGAVKEARRHGLWRCLALGVCLAHELAEADVPDAVLKDFLSDGNVRELAGYFKRHILAEPGQVPAGAIPYEIRILAFPERARAVFSPAFLRPNERDRAVVKLPKPLAPLYYLIRPVRLLLDRTGR